MMLKVELLTISHGKQLLIEPISFEVLSGQSLVIMGETGAGKSLIAQAIMGVLPHSLRSTGKVWLFGQRIDQLSSQARELLWGRQISMLPQEPWRSLDPLMRSFDQVYETHRYVSNDTNCDARVETEQQFKAFELTEAKRKRPWELSGGMGQRVSFCASIAGGAPVLLADEPTKGLDKNRIDTVIQNLQSVTAEGGALIVITHEASVATRIGGALLVLRNGKVVEAGGTEITLRRPEHEYTKELVKADPRNWPKPPFIRSDETILTLKKLVVGRQGNGTARPVDLSVFKGSRIAITGPSGVGKSTLLDTIAGLLNPISGSVEKAINFKATDIQKIYQEPPAAFAPTVTLRQTLLDVAKLHNVSWRVMAALLQRLGICEVLLDRRPDAVSGGELQRIAIARVLAVKPKILLADEPTSRLDPLTQKLTMQLLADIAPEIDTTVLLVTHDQAIANRWADDVLELTSSANQV